MKNPLVKSTFALRIATAQIKRGHSPISIMGRIASEIDPHASLPLHLVEKRAAIIHKRAKRAARKAANA